MSRIFVRILWGIVGVILIVGGIFCFTQPAAVLLTMSALLGVSMLLCGVVDLIIFARGRQLMFGAGGFLLDGILTVLLSLFLLFNQGFTALSLPFIFGMWLMFSGISKFVGSFDLKVLGVKGWGWFTVLGVLLAAAGFFSFLDPVAGAVTMSFLLGILLILQGITFILRAVFVPRLFR